MPRDSDVKTVRTALSIDYISGRFSGRSASSSSSYLGQPSPPSRVTSWLERLAEVRPAGILVGCLLIVALVGVADSQTGQDVSLSIFYLIPAVVAAAKGRRLGLLVAATAATAGFVADIAGRTTPYSSPVVPLWNAIVRLIVIVLVVSLVDALLRTARHERQMARRDHLTGLQNSRAFYDLAETELRGLARAGRPLTVAYIDIDRFKTVNDRLGHAAGDAVLVGTGRTLAGAMRDVDTAARIGGDEFIVLVPETDTAQAQVVLARVHRHLSEAAVASGWDVGYSVGAVTFTSPPRSIEGMVDVADRIVYEVKQSEKGHHPFRLSSLARFGSSGPASTISRRPRKPHTEGVAAWFDRGHADAYTRRLVFVSQ